MLRLCETCLSLLHKLLLEINGEEMIDMDIFVATRLSTGSLLMAMFDWKGIFGESRIYVYNKACKSYL